MPPTAPAAPVTRIGLWCLCFIVVTLTLSYVQKRSGGPARAGVFLLCGELTSARRQSGLPHDEALDPRNDDHQHRHDHDITRCRGPQPAHGEIGLEAIVQARPTNDMVVEVIRPVIKEIEGPISFGGRAICLLLGTGLLFIRRITYTL